MFRMLFLAMVIATSLSTRKSLAKNENENGDGSNYTHAYQESVIKLVSQFESERVAELLNGFKVYGMDGSDHDARKMNLYRNQLSGFLMGFSENYNFSNVLHSEPFPDPQVLDAVADFIAYCIMHSADGFRHQLTNYLLNSRADLKIKVAIVRHLQEDLRFDIAKAAPRPAGSRWRPALKSLLAWSNFTMAQFLEKYEVELKRANLFEPIRDGQGRIKVESGYFESTGCSPFLN